MTITTATLAAWLRRAAALIHEQRDALTRLDAAIGDADHGANLDRGFTAVVAALPDEPTGDAAALLKSAGLRLISTVGGASGPLYGTAFRRAGKALEGCTELSPDDLQLALHGFLEGVCSMGKAEPGDKTMVDAIAPAIAALDEALAANLPIADALRAAADAASAGVNATIPLVARRGRASYLGERSAGHQDPGATSAALILRALAEVVEAPTTDD
jgi:phosphoenolpyruvate---glycerone phosphotransferase subunit DhaL